METAKPQRKRAKEMWAAGFKYICKHASGSIRQTGWRSVDCGSDKKILLLSTKGREVKPRDRVGGKVRQDGEGGKVR